MLFVQVLERGYQVNSKFYKTAPTFLVERKTKILNFPVSEREPPNQLPLSEPVFGWCCKFVVQSETWDAFF